MQSGQQHLHPKIINVLAKQQAELVRDAPDGVIFYQNEEGDVTDIQADIVGPYDTPFAGGVFKCKLVIDGEFPQKPPKGYFLTKIFHPNVAQPSGEICVNTLKRDWNPKKWSLSHIFQIIKCLLIVPFPESALNEEAGRLFITSYEDFAKQARLYTQIHAKPNQKQVKLIQELEQKQKMKKNKAVNNKSNCNNLHKIVANSTTTADKFDAFKDSPSKQGCVMSQPQLQKTFSLGQATQQQQTQQLPSMSFNSNPDVSSAQQPAMFGGLGAAATRPMNGSSGSNFGVLGLSQVTNSMNPGLSAQPMIFDGGQKNEEKTGLFGALNNNPSKTGSSTFGFGENGGLGSGAPFGAPNGFGQNNSEMGFGGMGLGIGQPLSQGINMFGNGMQDQSMGFQDSQSSLGSMQAMNIGGLAPGMGTGGMITTQKNKKKIGGKCRI